MCTNWNEQISAETPPIPVAIKVQQPAFLRLLSSELHVCILFRFYSHSLQDSGKMGQMRDLQSFRCCHHRSCHIRVLVNQISPARFYMIFRSCQAVIKVLSRPKWGGIRRSRPCRVSLFIQCQGICNDDRCGCKYHG